MVYFVGAGTGAVDLITVRGMRLLEKADVIIYAGSLVNPELLSYAGRQCEIYNSAVMTLEEVIGVIAKKHAPGVNIVRLHTGDPSIYGAVREQMDRLDELGIPYESCPGVSACFGAAAALNMEFTLPEVSQSLIITRLAGRTGVPEKESLESLAAHQASMAIYLSTGMLGELSERLTAGGYKAQTPAALVYKATWPEEEAWLTTVGELEQTALAHGITKTALVLVGEAVTHQKYQRSRLYDPCFETGCRKPGVSMTEITGISIVCFTQKGEELAGKIVSSLEGRYAVSAKNKGTGSCLPRLEGSLGEWAEASFQNRQAMVFIGAAGIAVRTIASFVRDKLTDPPVLVLDELGSYVIPILSGHVGGANRLAAEIAGEIGAQAVITTATDLNGLFAVDVFAEKNRLRIRNKEGIARVSSRLLAGKNVTFRCEGEQRGKVPGQLVIQSGPCRERVQIAVSCRTAEEEQADLWLIPQTVLVGIGCKKGKTAEEIDEVLHRCLEKAGISALALAGFASVHLKKEEPGIKELASRYGIPFTTFSVEELARVPGHFSGSAFVEEQVGIDNVCARSAMAACGERGKLIMDKYAGQGVTIALAEKKWSVYFEEA